jgi:hypothetical protein
MTTMNARQLAHLAVECAQALPWFAGDIAAATLGNARRTAAAGLDAYASRAERAPLLVAVAVGTATYALLSADLGPKARAARWLARRIGC